MSELAATVADEMAAAIDEAGARISPYVLKTPLLRSLALSRRTGCDVHLKLESEQRTGSFKVRGVYNKVLLCLAAEERDGDATREFVTASCGNHGLACADALHTFGRRGVIFVPRHISAAKLAAFDVYDEVTVRRRCDDVMYTERVADEFARGRGLRYVGTADLDVIRGQGTVAKELIDDLTPRAPDVVFVSVSGGSCAAGVGAYLRSRGAGRTEVVGCAAVNCAAMMRRCCETDGSDDDNDDAAPATLAESCKGGVEKDSVAVQLCRLFVDRWVVVTEEEIAGAVRLVLKLHRKIVEGAAGVALAAFLRDPDRYQGKRVVVLLCGSNLSGEHLLEIVKDGRDC